MALGFFDVTRNTPKWVINKNGVLEQVPANVPAFEFNADGSYKGCLIEPAGTNLFRSSENSTTPASGTIVNTSFSNNDWNHPLFKNFDGKAILTTTAENASYYNTGNLSEGQYTVSFFARRVDGGVVNNESIRPVVGDGNIRNDASYTHIGQGIYFVKVTSTGSGSAFGCTHRVGWEFDDIDVEVTGIQVEAGANRTSYIKTTDSTATRNADVIVRDDAEDLIGQDEGTVFCQIEAQEKLDALSNVVIIGDDNDGVRFRRLSTGAFFAQLRVSGSTIGAPGIDLGFTDGINKVTIIYSETGIKCVVNGSLIDSIEVSFSPATMDQIQMGDFGGHIRSFALYKRALTEAEAIALTS